MEKLDKALELAHDPEHRWNRIKNYLINKEVPLFELALLEDDFVRRILGNKSFENFPNKRISKKLNEDVINILQSFAINILSKISIT